MPATETSSGGMEPKANVRMASSIARSGERRSLEEQFLQQTLTELITGWRDNNEYERMKCMELLFVSGLPNKEAAKLLNISEQAVANHKHFTVAKLKQAVEKAGLRDFDFERAGLSDN